MSKVWSTTFEDANDGTGDGILTFPEEIWLINNGTSMCVGHNFAQGAS